MSITEEHNYKHILEYVESRLIPDIDAKKNRGEVFTPLSLINNMLDHLPKKVWSNPNLKWLDPANGIGNFPICVYYRLMDGLKDLFADKKERSKHIIENMLYMIELDPTNVAISRSIFLDGNIEEQDFTKYIKPKSWPEKFDVIMGNPPFKKKFNNANNRVGGSSLWSVFINDSMNILIDNGLLLFITPISWMTGGSNKQSGNILNGIMKKNTMLYLNIEECKKYFNVGSTFSYYLIKKSFENINFNCICKYKNNIYNSQFSNNTFRKLLVIPKCFTNEMITIIEKVQNANKEKFKFHRVRDLDSSSQKKRYILDGKYCVRHKVVDIRKTNWKQECMGKSKVVISMPGYIKATYDKECGCSDATLFMYVKDKKEGDYIIKLLNNKIYQLIINNYRELTGLNNQNNINRLSISNLNDIKFTNNENKLFN